MDLDPKHLWVDVILKVFQWFRGTALTQTEPFSCSSYLFFRARVVSDRIPLGAALEALVRKCKS